jgi:SAM-dependent methyltransferase
MFYEYRGFLYPDYLKEGNACRFIIPTAKEFCKGLGLDVGAGAWPLPGATPVDVKSGGRAEDLPGDEWDYIFSSHCLEHVVNPIETLEHWKSKIRRGGVLFLYLPHPEMIYWRPQNCRKHLHIWYPEEMAEIMMSIGFENVIHGQRDLAWSFAVVGTKPL